MGLNSSLPALVPAVTVFIVISIAAGLTLAWNSRPQVQLIVRRAWLVATIVLVGGVAIFWLSTAIVGTHRPTVSRSLQQQQQDELRQRLKNGGH